MERWPEKLIQTSPFDMSDHDQRLKKEIAILKKCRHPNVVRLREVIDAPASKKIYLGMYRIVEAPDLYSDQLSKTSQCWNIAKEAKSNGKLTTVVRC